MFVVLMVMSVHLSHVIAHPFQLHGGSKEVELMKARDVGIESLLRAWLDMLVQVLSQYIIKLLCHIFCHKSCIDISFAKVVNLCQNGA